MIAVVVYMHLFHQRHFLCLTVAVSYECNIFKDVTNRSDIKAAIMKMLVYSSSVKTESTRKLINVNFQLTNTLYQNNLRNIAFFFTFFKG